MKPRHRLGEDQLAAERPEVPDKVGVERHPSSRTSPPSTRRARRANRGCGGAARRGARGSSSSSVRRSTPRCALRSRRRRELSSEVGRHRMAETGRAATSPAADGRVRVRTPVPTSPRAMVSGAAGDGREAGSVGDVAIGFFCSSARISSSRVLRSSFEARLNSLRLLPSDRPSSGSLRGPKTIRATTKMIIISGKPSGTHGALLPARPSQYTASFSTTAVAVSPRKSADKPKWLTGRGFGYYHCILLPA